MRATEAGNVNTTWKYGTGNSSASRFRDRPVVIAEDDIDRLIADPIDGHDLHGLRRRDAAHGCAVLDVPKPRRH